MTLTEFLLARIAEDEADAAEVQSHVNRWRREQLQGADGTQASIVLATSEGGPCDPQRVLAECEAKRRIVEVAGPREVWTAATVRIGAQEMRVPGEMLSMPGKCPEVLLILALPYADHPDYQQEWAHA